MVILCVWLNCAGVIHSENFLDGQTIELICTLNICMPLCGKDTWHLFTDSKFCSQTMKELIIHERPVINSMNFRKSNWSYTQHIIWTLFLQIITFSDPWLIFFWCSLRFSRQEEVDASVKEFLTSNDKIWYRCRIKELTERWHQTVQYDDLCFES